MNRVLFIHQNYPAQFGHIARYLARNHDFNCTFVSEKPPGWDEGVERIQYKIQGGATAQTHYCSRTFENGIWHSHAIYQALRSRPDVQPELVVAHSGFCTSIFLRELYRCPIVNYFEYFYYTRDSDMDFRPDFPSGELDLLRARARNALLLLDLENCDRGYSPTVWQRNRLPAIFHSKVPVIFDGVDTQVWKPMAHVPRRIGNLALPDHVRVVTYVSRGMESMRGFDIFMKVARKIYQRRSDVIFVVVGQDRICYGGDAKIIGGQSFKDWVLSQDLYELERFHFLGLVPPDELARIFSLSDLHIYLTVPFVLSWSLLNALACGTTVLASNTAPVREMIEHGKTGLLADFFDVDGLAEQALQVLDAPGDYKHLGAAGRAMVDERYSLEVCLPRMLELYRDACA